jgi:hypothetical protein
MRPASLFPVVLLLIFTSVALFGQGTEKPAEPKKELKLQKAERSFGAGWFRKSGYKDFIEPRVSFYKRKGDYSEVVEYAWRPMVIHGLSNKERIDVIRFLYNRYYYFGREKRVFGGVGVGGNALMFSRELKDWAMLRKIDLKDGLSGLGRVAFGYKFSQFKFGKKVYPLVVRIDGYFSPPYRFGGNLGAAGDKLKLTEITGGLSFSIE